MSVIKYFVNHFDKIWQLSLDHILLISIGIIFSLIIWITVGIAVRNNKKVADGVLNIGSFIMSVPSIALYGILVSIPGFGLSRRSAVFGLILYAMLPIVRNVYVALNQVDASILESARGMGMTNKQILIKVQMPLAMPIILAGVRVALVMMVGVATLSVYIGERNLGRLIQQGISRTHIDMIVVGALLVSALAIFVDFIMGRVQKHLVSPGLLSGDLSNSSKKGVA